MPGLEQVGAHPTHGELAVAGDDRGEQVAVLLRHLRGPVVMRPQLDEAVGDLGVDGRVGAHHPGAPGGLDERPVEAHVLLDDLVPGGRRAQGLHVVDGARRP
jgi:hypothetical protein